MAIPSWTRTLSEVLNHETQSRTLVSEKMAMSIQQM